MSKWICDKCTLKNNSTNNECAVCGAKRSTSTSKVVQNRTTESIQTPGNSSRSIKSDSGWKCSRCSYQNDENHNCEMCEAPRQTETMQVDNTIEINNGWKCNECSFVNRIESSVLCERCKKKRIHWSCPKCTLDNAIGKPICRLCGTRDPTRPPAPNVDKSPKVLMQRSNSVISPRIQSALTSTSRSRDRDSATTTFKRIMKFCRDNRTNFIDDGFAPTDRSVGEFDDEYQGAIPGLKPRNLIWLRPQNIFTKDGHQYRWSVFRDPSSTDIEQGVLGNCWFLSALAVIAERPDVLDNIVLTKEYNHEGVYQIRLCVDGNWQVITIDDCFPCHQTSRSLAFSVGRRNQLWVPLIEKAFAKVAGSYSALTAGRSVEGLAVLTGAACERISTESENGDTQSDVELIWATIVSSKEAGFLMGCSCGAGKRSIVDREFERVGLLSKHAYSLLNAKEIDGKRFVQLRNPWGKHVWNGDWSAKWSGWTKELRQQLAPERLRSGMFWMSFVDFCTYFDSVDIAKVRTPESGWKELRLPVKLPPHWLPETSTATRLIVEDATELCLTLHQENSRKRNLDPLDLFILVVSENAREECCVDEYIMRSKRDSAIFVATKERFVARGVYLVLCCSFAHWNTSRSAQCTMVMHSSKAIFAESIAIPPTVLADALSTLVVAEGKIHKSSLSGCIPRYLTNDFGGIILVMDNLLEDRYIQVNVDCSQSNNVVSTRGTMHMADTVPPLHRQVLTLLSHMEPSQSYYVQHYLSHRYSNYAGLRDWSFDGANATANHIPQLTHSVYGLHSPRPLFRI